MRRLAMLKILGCALILSMFLMSSIALADDAPTLTINIDVAPNVLNIESQGEVVTVHTDIAYSLVEGASVLLNGLGIDWWKADEQGNFVAKFLMDEVKTLEGLIIGGDNLLTLTGMTSDGAAFIGTQIIKVIDIKPKGK